MRVLVTSIFASLALLVPACTVESTNASSTSGTSTSTSSSGTSSEASGTGGATTSSSGAGGTGGATSSSTGAGAGFNEAQHPDVPQVVSLGGKVLASPKAMIISYTNDPNGPEVDKVAGELDPSGFWGTVTSEYGVGKLTTATPVHRPEAAPSSLNENMLVADLKANLSGANPAWGAADSSTIYTFVIPKGTTFTGGGTCCTDFDGYHTETTVGATPVVWAIVCSCPGFDGKGVSDVDQISVALSHELVEAATDPFTGSGSAYAQTDDAHAAFTIVTEGEVADMCEFDDDQYLTMPGISHKVQRSWSNAAAKAGHEPCLPAPAEPYFNAAPVLNDDITLQYYGAWPTKGVKIPVNQQKTIDVELFSDGPTGAWDVSADDYSALYGGPKLLDLQLDKTSGKNGDVLKLTIKVLAKDMTNGGELFMITSRSNGASSMWVGAVGN